MEEQVKIAFVSSSGGHLNHLYLLRPFWEDKKRVWVTYDKKNTKYLLRDEKIYYCHYPTNRNVKNLIRNTRIAWQVLRKEKPDIIISTGEAIAIPFFYLGRLMGKKLIYIEVYDRMCKPTVTGRLVYPIVDQFIVQWEEMKKVYPKAVNFGSIF